MLSFFYHKKTTTKGKLILNVLFVYLKDRVERKRSSIQWLGQAKDKAENFFPVPLMDAESKPSDHLNCFVQNTRGELDEATQPGPELEPIWDAGWRLNLLQQDEVLKENPGFVF